LVPRVRSRAAVRGDFAAPPTRWPLGPLLKELGPSPHEDEGAAIAALLAEPGYRVEAVRAAAG
jgi:hypothetical protein